MMAKEVPLCRQQVEWKEDNLPRQEKQAQVALITFSPAWINSLKCNT